MATEAYDKKCIALAQLGTALRLFHDDGDLFSIITLAGAAEEILGKLVEKGGIDHSLTALEKAAGEIHKAVTGESLDDEELSLVGNRANRARNAVKHLAAGGEATVTMHVREEAVDILTRAVDNYWLLENSVTPAMAEFDRVQHTPLTVEARPTVVKGPEPSARRPGWCFFRAAEERLLGTTTPSTATLSTVSIGPASPGRRA